MKTNACPVLLRAALIACTFTASALADIDRLAASLPPLRAAEPTFASAEPLQLAWCQGMTYRGIAYPSYDAMNRAIARDRAAQRNAATAAQQAQSVQVRNDQQSLRSLGYYRGNVDGRVGPATITAISDFRAANNLGPGTTLDAGSRQLIASGKAVAKENTASNTGGKPLSTRETQQMLADLGFYKGPIDGLQGPMTNSAVRQFKAQNGLDGRSSALDAPTRTKLAQARAQATTR